eukprot:PhM_4_TR2093/c1_g1_i12/m.20546
MCGRDELLKLEPFADGLFPTAIFPLDWARPGKSVPETSKLIAAFVLAVVGVGKTLKAFRESEHAAQKRDDLCTLGPHAERAIACAFIVPDRWNTAEGIFDLLMMEFQREKDEHFRHALIASVVPVDVFASREFEDFAKGGLRQSKHGRIRSHWLDKPAPAAPKSTPKAPPNPPPSQKGASMKLVAERLLGLLGGGDALRVL